MNREKIIRQLQQNHSHFIQYIDSLSETDFMFSWKNEKWSAGQQLEHIHLSVKPLAQGIILPKGVVGVMFGKANRASKAYDELVQKYNIALENGGKATANFVPKPVLFSDKENLKIKLTDNVNKLCKHLRKYSENDLDAYILPHPLLGKLTMREMMYFTIHHVSHHQQITHQYLINKN